VGRQRGAAAISEKKHSPASFMGLHQSLNHELNFRRRHVGQDFTYFRAIPGDVIEVSGVSTGVFHSIPFGSPNKEKL
jgi:hypothetical protein